MPVGGAVLSAAREVQIPILAMLLIGACAAKAQRAIGTHSINAAISPSVLFPLRLRKPVTLVVCASELAIGGGLVATAGSLGQGGPATAFRVLAALLFGTAVGALHEVRSRRPGIGCGCFGDLSDTPVSVRTLARSALLCVAAIASVGVPPVETPVSVAQALWLVWAGGAELALIVLLSPEVGEIMIRLGYAEPCEARRLPVSRTLTALRGSGTWRHYQPYLAASEPSDVWREGCWHFAVYSAVIAGMGKDVVFAVYLRARRPPVRAAVVDVVPAAAFVPVRSDAWIRAESGAGTVPAPPPRLAHPSVPVLTTALAPVRRHSPATPVWESACPSARATLRVPPFVQAVSPLHVPLRHPRFVPHHLAQIGARDQQRSSGV
jgi:hypothetical protein